MVDFGSSCFPYLNEDLCNKDNYKDICCKLGSGTLYYVPPEYFKWRIRYPKSDIWSFGATLYFIINDTNIWDLTIGELSLEEFDKYILSHEPNRLETPYPSLDLIINGMLIKDLHTRLSISNILEHMANI